MEMLPGHRFYPTEEELVSFYLHNKLEGKRQDLNQVMDMIIPVLDIYDFNPWDLPQYSGVVCKKDPEQWFFFIPRQESEARGGRPRRLTSIGYWKATGSPGYIYSDNRSIGMKRTMVFYRGRAPNGQKTEWKMNEYKAIQEDASSESTAPPKLRDEFSLCRVYKNSKQLRAFDRRPLGVEGVEVRGMRAQQVPEEAPIAFTMESHQTPPVMERTSSSQSSSSGDHDNNVPSQAQENSNLAMPFDSDELPWDWELCWFHGGENSQLN